eukprot:TCONS_00014393-protein
MGRAYPEYTKYQSISKTPFISRVRGMSGGDETDFKYEHFPVVCPTCQGSKFISEEDTGMVTFVPVKDERLKPAWTKLKVAMMVLFLTTAGGICAYFLYPRSVEFHVSAHTILKFSFQEGSTPWMEYSFDVSVKNNNFFGVTVKDIKMNLLFMKQSIVNMSVPDIHVGLRSQIKTIIIMNATYDDRIAQRYLRKQCYTERDYVGQLMQTSGELDYWVHSEHIESRDDYFYTDCGSLVFPAIVKTTLPPPTTTTTTTLPPTTTTSTVPTTVSSSTVTQGPITTSSVLTTKKLTSTVQTTKQTSTTTSSTTTTTLSTTTLQPTTRPTHSKMTGHIITMETAPTNPTTQTITATTAQKPSTTQTTKPTTGFFTTATATKITGHIITMESTTTPSKVTTEKTITVNPVVNTTTKTTSNPTSPSTTVVHDTMDNVTTSIELPSNKTVFSSIPAKTLPKVRTNSTQKTPETPEMPKTPLTPEASKTQVTPDTPIAHHTRKHITGHIIKMDKGNKRND